MTLAVQGAGNAFIWADGLHERGVAIEGMLDELGKNRDVGELATRGAAEKAVLKGAHGPRITCARSGHIAPIAEGMASPD
ncbi:MAG TPA: hypothetical protein VGD71_34790 [Kribbella sp.]